MAEDSSSSPEGFQGEDDASSFGEGTTIDRVDGNDLVNDENNENIVDKEKKELNQSEDESSDQPWYLKHINVIGATGVLSFIVGTLFSYGVSSMFESKTNSMMNERIYQLEHIVKQKQHDLHIASERLTNEIEISRAASRHNIELSKQKEHFEAQYLIQSRNLNLATEEIQSCEKTIDTCRNTIKNLENLLEVSKKEVENLKSDIEKKDGEILQLNETISKHETLIKDQQTIIEKQKERITTLKETHRIFEYVLHKASPQLASRIINQIHRVQDIGDESQDLNSKLKE